MALDVDEERERPRVAAVRRDVRDGSPVDRHGVVARAPRVQELQARDDARALDVRRRGPRERRLARDVDPNGALLLESPTGLVEPVPVATLGRLELIDD